MVIFLKLLINQVQRFRTEGRREIWIWRNLGRPIIRRQDNNKSLNSQARKIKVKNKTKVWKVYCSMRRIVVRFKILSKRMIMIREREDQVCWIKNNRGWKMLVIWVEGQKWSLQKRELMTQVWIPVKALLHCKS